MDIEDLLEHEFQVGSQAARAAPRIAGWRWGFERDAFVESPQASDTFVNREAELGQLARLVGQSVAGKAAVAPVVGPRGSGLGSLFHFLLEAMGRRSIAQGTYVSFSRLREREEAGPGELLDEISDPFVEFLDRDWESFQFVVFDDADLVAENLTGIMEQVDRALAGFKKKPGVFFGLHLSGWLRQIESGFEAQPIWLDELEPRVVVEILERRISLAKGSDEISPFTKASLQEIAGFSFGNPTLALRLARKCLEEASTQNLASIDIDVVQNVATRNRFLNQESLSRLDVGKDEVRFQLVSHLLKRDGGVSSSMLEREKTMGRTTANYHLAILDAAGLLERRRRGREVFYLPTNQGLIYLESFAQRVLRGKR